MKHTQGKWQYDEAGFIVADGNMIADPHMTKEISICEREANAKLMTTAPELLAACRLAIAMIIPVNDNRVARKVIKNAIKNAETPG